MNKHVLFFLLSFTVLTGINAQVRLGAYGGFHSANVIESNDIPGWDTAVKSHYSSSTRFHAGIMLEIPLGKGFFFQPGLNYSQKGRKYSKYNDPATAANLDTVYVQSTLKISYIELPLYLTYKIYLTNAHKNSFFLSAGPYLSFFYSGNMNTQSQILSTSKYNSDNEELLVGNTVNKYKTVEMGVNARAGFEFGNVMLSGYFSQGLTNFYTPPYEGTFHHRLIGATIGIWLTKSKTKTPEKVANAIVDTDNDGVPDDQDQCPTVAGTIARHGCPVPDTDGDGLDDDHDSCKTVKGIARYNGCPVPDTDGDGIDDDHDSCKTVKGTAKYHGCPIPDTDGDGINDEEDKCPNKAGTKENSGCPLVVKKEIAEKIRYTAKNILFNTASDDIAKSSYPALNDLVVILKAHPEWHLTIGGFTDTVGTPERNLKLSQRRASAVKIYLIEKGLAGERVTAIGYGQEQPVADNATEEGRAANRRVELKLSVQK